MILATAGAVVSGRADEPRRILVVKLCCLGDALMSTPAIAAIGERYPNATIEVATGAWTRPAFEGNPRVQRIVCTDPILSGRAPNPIDALAFVRRLARGRYDLAVVMERSFIVAALVAATGIGRRVGFDSGGRGLPHTDRVPVPPIAHEADLYLRLANGAGAAGDPRPMEFAVRPGASEAMAQDLRARGIEGPYAVLHPGGGTNPGMRLLTKRWPADRFAEIARRLIQHDIVPVVAWSDLDRDAADAVLASCPAARSCGPLRDIATLGALATRARLYLGNDTGPTHVATAVGAPTFVIFGPSDERRYGPWRPLGSAAGPAVAIAEPLLAMADSAPAWLNRSTLAVSVDQVWGAVEAELARTPETPGARAAP